MWERSTKAKAGPAHSRLNMSNNMRRSCENRLWFSTPPHPLNTKPPCLRKPRCPSDRHRGNYRSDFHPSLTFRSRVNPEQASSQLSTTSLKTPGK